ncbi:transposase Mu [Mesorhizobium sp. LNHC209A00]|nr:transposase Mu [Mesorhizobium sp. LNHC209A00]
MTMSCWSRRAVFFLRLWASESPSSSRIGVHADGRREVLGMEIGTSEAEPIWTEFLRKLTRRGLRGVKLVVSDAHEGLKSAVTKVLSATWQRCRVHFIRNVLAHAGKSGRRVVSAFIATAFV